MKIEKLGLNIFRVYSAQDIYDQLSTILFHPPYPQPGKSSRILLKPNCNANMNSLTGNTTDLRIIFSLVKLLKDLGYHHIVIGEGTNSGYYRNNISVMKRLKLDRLTRYFGIEMIDLNFSKGRAIEFETGTQADVADICFEADYFINLPKMKTHFEAGMSVCLKNLMGCLVGQENKKKTHESLAANINNINKAIRPDLQIVDAMVAMEGLGPTRGTPKLTDLMIVGTDPYACDLACAQLADIQANSLPVIDSACSQGLIPNTIFKMINTLDLARLASTFAPPKAGPLATYIHHPKRQKHFLKIRNTPFFTYLASTGWFGNLLFLTGLRQDVFCKHEMNFQGLKFHPKICINCGTCQIFCPQGLNPPQMFREKTCGECLDCLYCYMVCPKSAFEFFGDLGFLEEQTRQYGEMIGQFYHHYSAKKDRMAAKLL